MNPAGSAAITPPASLASRLRDYWALSKPRVTLLVWISTAAGMALAGGAPPLVWFAALAGSWFVIASANALNQVLEVGPDSRMLRTASRPLPDGRISVGEGVAVGLTWAAIGLALLVIWVNPLTALLGAASIIVYAFVYTPLKPRSHMSTAVGAIPGAIPPLAGWTAATGEIGLPALLLFGIQFFWQFPHFWSIAWLLREDYSRAGFRMLPFPDADGRATGLCVVQYSLPLIPLVAAFSFFATQKVAYIIFALILTAWMISAGVRFLRLPGDATARKVLRATVAYLPLLLLLMILCR
jgi:protoheme IX farnesyltransferase